jgi:hypothetical protein
VWKDVVDEAKADNSTKRAQAADVPGWLRRQAD